MVKGHCSTTSFVVMIMVIIPVIMYSHVFVSPCLHLCRFAVWKYTVQNRCLHRITTWNVQWTGYSVIPMRSIRQKWISSHLPLNQNIWMAKEVCSVLFYTLFNISLLIICQFTTLTIPEISLFHSGLTVCGSGA